MLVEKAVISRTYFDFIAKGADGKTPAMRMARESYPVRGRAVFQLVGACAELSRGVTSQ
jgi:hypothetical protein